MISGSSNALMAYDQPTLGSGLPQDGRYSCCEAAHAGHAPFFVLRHGRRLPVHQMLDIGAVFARQLRRHLVHRPVLAVL